MDNANVTHVSFNHSWADYERGFGDLNTEFWYGLRNIHCLTEREEVELQIELRQNDGTGQVWTYGYFEVDSPETNYTLHIGQAQGPSRGVGAGGAGGAIAPPPPPPPHFSRRGGIAPPLFESDTLGIHNGLCN